MVTFLPSHFSTYRPITLCRKVALNGFFRFSIIIYSLLYLKMTDLFTELILFPIFKFVVCFLALLRY